MAVFYNTIFALSFLSLLLTGPSRAQTTSITTAVRPVQSSSTTLQQPPTCANSCIETAIQAQSCANTDNLCLCSQTSAIQSAISTCLSSSKTCFATDTAAAIAFYPQYCALLGFGTSMSSSAAIVSATGAFPSKVVLQNLSTLLLTSSSTSTAGTTAATDSSQKHHGLTLPAMLGIILTGVIILSTVIVIFAWTFHRRKQEHQLRLSRKRIADSESQSFTNRPPRYQSPENTYSVVQSPEGKTLSSEKAMPPRPSSESSTFVSYPSPLAIRDKALPRIQQSPTLDDIVLGGKSSNARKTTWSTWLNSAYGIRTSWFSPADRNSRNSLTVEPLNISKGDGLDQIHEP